MKKLKPWLWVTDSWNTLDHPNDTSIRLMQSALEQKIPTYWASETSVFLNKSEVFVRTQQVTRILENRSDTETHRAPEQKIKISEFSKIIYRTDPPVDLHYLHPLQLLEQGRGQAELINPAPVLVLTNEKFSGSLFQEFSPSTWVGSHPDDLLRILDLWGRVVLKPLHTAQSHGVTLLTSQRQNRKRNYHILQTETQNFTRPVLLQKYLAEITEGEMRVWFVDGKPLAYALKKPIPGDFRVQIDRGSPVTSLHASLTRKQKTAVSAIGKHLKKIGARMAAVDWIGHQISDFNVTSPGLIVQMEKATGKNLASPIISLLRG